MISSAHGNDLGKSRIRSRCATSNGDCFARKGGSGYLLRADARLQTRIEELAEKSTEGALTEDERAEYAGYVRANKFVAILKRQAQHLTNAQS